MRPHTDNQRRPAWQLAAPNALTGVRLLLTAGFVALLSLEPPRLLIAAALFAVAAATDAIDGFLARRWDAVSRLGRIADPFADKILVLGAFVVLAGPNLAPLTGVAPWMAVVILARELLVTSIRGLYEAEGHDFSAGLSGKLKMAAQSVAVPLILLAAEWQRIGLHKAGSPASPPPVALAAAWGVTILTAASAFPSLLRAIAIERRTNKDTAP